MKAIRLFGVALLTVLLSVSLSSCSKSDDDNGGGSSSASIEGTWYLKAEKWYGWKNGQPDMSNETINKTHGDYDDNRIWVIKKSGSNYILTEKRPSQEKEYTLTSVGNNACDAPNANANTSSMRRNAQKSLLPQTKKRIRAAPVPR